MSGALAGLLLLCAAVLLAVEAAEPKATSHGHKVVCYFTNWSHKRKEGYSFTPDNVDPHLCTHIIYAFADIGHHNNIVSSDSEYDIDQHAYQHITDLKKRNEDLKVMLSVGGWNEGSLGFAKATADENNRREFAENAVRFLRGYNFDGLDLNWQHPTFREGGTPEDKQNYALLAKALREEFEREAELKDKHRLLLSIAISHNPSFLPAYDIPAFNKYMDFISVICYDYHFSHEDAVNHHSPLFPLKHYDHDDEERNINSTIHYFMKMADPEKLVLGIPTYGRSYKLVDPDQTALGSKADGPTQQGFFAFYEICNFIEKEHWMVVHPQPGAVGPYAYKGNRWVGFDDVEMAKTKALYAKSMKLAGIMFWTIDYDDFLGECGHHLKFPVIRAARDQLEPDTDRIVFQSIEEEEEGPGEMIDRMKAKLAADRRRRYSAPTPPPCRHLEPPAPHPRHPPPPLESQLSGPVTRPTRQQQSSAPEPDIDSNILADLIRLIEKAGGLKKLCNLLRQAKLLNQSKSPNTFKQEYGKPGNENTIVLETQRMPAVQIQISNSSIYIKEVNIYTNGKP